MQELGRILRSTRESLGYSLEEVEEKTKIRKRYLVALEEGDWSVLPGRVYARGFVRNYADMLGLDGLDLLQRFVDGRTGEETDMNKSATTPLSEPTHVSRSPVVEPKQQAEQDEHNVEATAPSVSSSKRETVRPRVERPARERGGRQFSRGAVGQTLIIVGTLVILGGGYLALRDYHHASTGKPGKTTQITANGSTPTNKANSTERTQTGGGKQSDNTPKHSTPPKTKPAMVITSQPLENDSTTYLVKNVSSMKVDIAVTSGDCWVSVTVDGKTVNGNDIINAGDKQTFTGKQSVEFHLGHVQGVSLTVNGKALTLPSTNDAIYVQIKKQG